MSLERATYGHLPVRGAFTLVEVVVVLAILGVAAVAIVPALRPLMREDRATEAAEAVAQLLRSGRMAAIQRAMPVAVLLDPSSGAYRVQAEAEDSTTLLAAGTLSLRPDATPGAGRAWTRFAFGPLGDAQPDSLTVSGEAGSLTVVVDRWTGDVLVRAAGQ